MAREARIDAVILMRILSVFGSDSFGRDGRDAGVTQQKT